MQKDSYRIGHPERSCVRCVPTLHPAVAPALGANDEELQRPMLGDDEIQKPLYATTRAVTINAKPADIWPWLVQMGYQRGGLYSYDWLDGLFGILDRPSADWIIPEFQRRHRPGP